MTLRLIILFSLFLALSCNKITTNTKSPEIPAGNGFEIYFLTDTNFRTSTYDYDSTWQNFLKNATLANNKITDEDIEWYDWEKQQILLNESGKGHFLKCLDDKKSDPRFIVTLNGKRIYAGLVILRFTQMALRYPILSYDEDGSNSKVRFEKNPVLFLQPYLVMPKNKEALEAETVNNSEIYNYFKEKGKLK